MTRQRNLNNVKATVHFLSHLVIMVGLLMSPYVALGQTLDASKLVPRAELSFTPRAVSFTEGSTFDVTILLNTRGNSVNAIEVKVSFDRDKLEIVRPLGGQSLIGVWVEPPSYDNSRGIASYVGAIPGGITTSAGSVGTITFRAKKIGQAALTFGASTKVLLNNGQGSEAQVDLGRGEYSILPKAPDGVRVYSETHPFSGDWYNNNSPVLQWEKDNGVTGFSYVLDDKPLTIPENSIMTRETVKSFEDLKDGLWYFHIKAIKNGVWGQTGHFLMRVDTAPPAEFKVKIDYLLAASILTERALVHFLTTDNLSGIDHYEVGVIDKNQPVTVSPAFVYAESPYQVPLSSDNLNVIVRAVDRAGNARDVSAAVEPQSFASEFLSKYLLHILLFIILAGICGWLFHYLVGHHIIRHFRRALELAEKEDKTLNVKEEPPHSLLKQDEIIGNYPNDKQG